MDQSPFEKEKVSLDLQLNPLENVPSLSLYVDDFTKDSRNRRLTRLSIALNFQFDRIYHSIHWRLIANHVHMQPQSRLPYDRKVTHVLDTARFTFHSTCKGSLVPRCNVCDIVCFIGSTYSMRYSHSVGLRNEKSGMIKVWPLY